MLNLNDKNLHENQFEISEEDMTVAAHSWRWQWHRVRHM